MLIVGAGPIGLAMASALKSHGIAYDQVDAGSGIGGNWHHGIYAGVHTISSKTSTGYADYPMPDAYPDFPSGAQMLAYLQAFARDRGLTDHVELGRKVAKAEPLVDESWAVTFEDGKQRVYKGVIVCNGHHWDKRYPKLAGEFSGELLHSNDFRGPEQFAGKRILIIGSGNSGCDMACEAARNAAACDWSLRDGYWFLPKTFAGKPLTDLPIWLLPEWAQRIVVRAIVKIAVGDYRKYGLPKPSHKLFERHPTFGTEALGYLRQGRIRVRPGIERCDGSTVRFTNGETADYDMVVAATGFYNSIPFLPEGLVPIRNDIVELYGGIFPVQVKNLYIVGAQQVRNGFGIAITPAAELFARMIKVQDELPYAIGAILKFIGESPPRSQFVNPAEVRRKAWWGKKAVPLLKIYSRILTRLGIQLEKWPGLAGAPVSIGVSAPVRPVEPPAAGRTKPANAGEMAMPAIAPEHIAAGAAPAQAATSLPR